MAGDDIGLQSSCYLIEFKLIHIYKLPCLESQMTIFNMAATQNST